MNYFRQSSNLFIRIVATAILVLSIIGVSAALISMLSGRPIGDDYGAISTHHIKGDWVGEAAKSLATTGRYGQSIAASVLFGVFGENIPIVLPIITLAWLFVLGFLYFNLVLKKYAGDNPRLAMYSLGLSSVFTFLTLFVNNPPQLVTLPGWASFQLFFWPSGIVTYTLPLLILLTTLYLALMSPYATSRLSSKMRLSVLALVILATSLFNEVQPATLFAFSVILFIASYIKYFPSLKKHRWEFPAVATLAGLGLLSSFFSSGRVKRSEEIAAPQDGSILDSIMRNLLSLGGEHTLQPRELAILFTVGLILAVAAPKTINSTKRYKSLVSSLAPTTLLLLSFLISSTIVSLALIALGYGYSAGIYPRTLLIPQLIYVIAIPLIIFTAASLLLSTEKRVAYYIVVVSLLCTGIATLTSLPNYTSKITVQVKSSMLYAHAWDAQDALLKKEAREHEGENLYIENPAIGIGDGFNLTCTGPYATSTMWLNVQIWEYYNSNAARICEKPQEEIVK